MPSGRLCIICGARKPESLFEKRGEHIVPRFLGNKRLRTPHVCADCNGGLGGTVDVALKNVLGVALACFNRGVGWARGDDKLRDGVRLDSVFRGYCCGDGERRIGKNGHIGKNGYLGRNEHMGRGERTGKGELYDDDPFESPDIKGAILKIAYEAAHLRLGSGWLDDSKAAAIREILLAYVNKDKEKARALANGIIINSIPIDAFYFAMRAPRSEFLKRAISGRTCLNSLWLSPKKSFSNDNDCDSNSGSDTVLAVVFDIEGIPPGYVIVSESVRDVAMPELLAPKTGGRMPPLRHHTGDR